MTTRAHDSDPSGSSHAGAQPFAGLGAGLGFFQDWMKAAGAALPGMGAPSGAGIPGVPSWSVPTLDPEELDKRIQELKTVQFWLEQNSRMIAMTIQGMEVQKMTLSTLKGMNVSMDALRDTLKAQPASAMPDTAQSAASPVEPAAEATASDLINPMHWWDTLTQQFSHLASQASQTAQSVGQSVEASMQDMVAKAQAAAAPAAAAAAEVLKPATPKPRARTTASKTPARKQAASKAARKTPPKA
ncbi:PhaM family polyhydroxyalkanoate granule multifunctional regulatory protein [Aquabacterium sp.]|uniref:PhaM family polyhydroxyalkanoate granule multifunctional regulatory protein n=1 Tax=Aquabacterium sp. TaxID=1872578 RepID=UPI0027BA5D1B|nr:PhaM family polyhydroxyalkanoate granule multifunctional regulatory protein [Aquabacterium sp.]